MSEGRAKEAVYREFIISGRVQGVGYRYFVMQTAVRYGITGRVKNLLNGKVRVQASGDLLEEFAEKLKEGPRFARVDEIETRDLSWTCEYENFRIG